jgi:hypothetical protein
MLGFLYLVTKELLQKGQHGIAGKCHYLKKMKSRNFLITPHSVNVELQADMAMSNTQYQNITRMLRLGEKSEL